MLFLSYAEEDSEQARKIVDWFTRQNVSVYYWEDPAHRGGRFIDQMERQLSRATAFIALVSAHFIPIALGSPRNRAGDPAQDELQRGHPGARFIRVLKIARTRRTRSAASSMRTTRLT